MNQVLRHLLLVLAVVAVVAGLGRAQEAPPVAESPRVSPLVKLTRQVLPAIVAVRGLRPGKEDGVTDINHGGGSVIHPSGYILTNAHVVTGAQGVEVAFFEGEWRRVEVVAESVTEDLALLKLASDKPLAVLPLGRSDDLELGEPVITIGSAGGLPHSLSTGVISGLHRATETEYTVLPEMVQTTASISGGSSGGPLINALGELVGVVTSNKDDGENLGFAITVDRVRKVLPQVLAVEQRFGITHGLTIDTLGPTAKIVAVAPHSPAAAAGLQAGDALVKVDSETVSHGSQFYLSLAARKPGDRLACVVRRGDQEIASELALAATPSLSPVAVANLQPGLRVARYHGEWERLPDFAQLTPVEELVRTSSPRVRPTPDGDGPDHYAKVYAGYVKIPTAGFYSFTLTSDDGSKLMLGEQTIIDNDGLHSEQSQLGLVRLEAGLYPLRLEYFEATGAQLLRVKVSGPNTPTRDLPPEWLFHSPPQ